MNITFFIASKYQKIRARIGRSTRVKLISARRGSFLLSTRQQENVDGIAKLHN